MCTNCVSNAEIIAGKVALAAWLLKDPARRALADLGVVEPFDIVKQDVRTVGYLRSLELDPVEILGAPIVEAADAWVPQPARARRWAWRSSSARPIGSQSLAITQ